ncbi:restriction endonuclease subunit S [Vibrio vulnificus]|uniref:Restriction endonuclease subunit S n=1 Tax=Vibrio parahaemolyticus TaxID=670 RepID=A0A7Z2RNV4_VIBPH|nr:MULTISPECIES: restriction endonuclease subunit S [Vibrio]MBH9739326.1 restriction endonuclease subunit S [Vibrio navarrensis]QHH09637.1 restriction endonuclease subunit S [Vibrio parahaemolyticus]UJX07185.1 restriction endonuclease subunit S [Vibrio parahaemolyticus]HAS6674354.1 restriction endonuclease subunit S [Vibrio parahaemolyticus]HAS6680047.1 restriction endonuclease subunit S [Vibrio parahaemolyticus]
MTGRYKAYPEYKSVDANITIPMGWNYCQAKRYLTVQSGDMLPAARVRDSGTPVVGGNGYRGFTDSANTKANTIVIGRVGAKCGCVHTIKEDFWASEHAFKVISRKQYNMSFMAYLLESLNLNQYAITTAQPLLNTEIVTSKYISLPNNLVEQQKIANFLDHETAKIDTLIAKQEKLIELLKEKRQAVISHAVTKGLNQDAPMKDSGVEWLGEVPEHWVIKSYRYACKIYRGKFGHRPRNDPAFYDGEYPFIQTGDVARAGKYIKDYKQTLNEKGIGVSQKFPVGTLMMAIAANIGDTAILGFEAYAPDSVVGFKPKADIDLEFLRYSFMAAFPALEQTSTQSTQANLNVDRIGAVQASFPSISEQREIVAYLDTLLEQYDDIESKSQKSIELMKERKTALISAAVTGKIDVRDWEPK